MRNVGLLAIAAAVGFAGVYGFTQSPMRFDCTIKGNISIGGGERIYHMPGQQYYDETVISPQYGEHWFCTEAEAQAAGWRKAGR